MLIMWRCKYSMIKYVTPPVYTVTLSPSWPAPDVKAGSSVQDSHGRGGSMPKIPQHKMQRLWGNPLESWNPRYVDGYVESSGITDPLRLWNPNRKVNFGRVVDDLPYECPKYIVRPHVLTISLMWSHELQVNNSLTLFKLYQVPLKVVEAEAAKTD